MTLLPNVVKNLSVLRNKEAFGNLKLNNEETWIKAQKLQEHIKVCGRNLYLFLNRNYYIKKPKITKELVKGHVWAYNSQTFQNFLQKRLFYIFDHANEFCECRNFHHYGYCKHYLAVKIYLEEIQVLRRSLRS